MAQPYSFVRQGRAPFVVALLICIYTALIAGVILIDAAWWLMAALALTTLPAVRDLYQDPSAGVDLDDTTLDWHSRNRSASMSLSEIDHMRFDTRWDFSVRVSAVLTNKKRVRLPYESLPPHREFETALTDRGVRVERHHFVIF